jgi:hypothetical protein
MFLELVLTFIINFLILNDCTPFRKDVYSYFWNQFPPSLSILCSISVDENHELLKNTGCRDYGRKMSPVYIFEIDVDAISGIEL